jgi:putative transposase
VLERISQERGLPKSIWLDNGPEFTSKVLDKWAHENGVTLDFSRPGKPVDNGYVESFNGRFREECLNANRFLSLKDAEDKIGIWSEDYNVSRLHMSLGYMAPMEFASLSGDIPGKAVAPKAGNSLSPWT